MYMTSRTLHAHPTRLPDAMSFLGYVVDRLNSEHGASMGYSVQVGNDPTALAVTGPWETLGAYEAARASMAADGELQSAIRVAGELFTSAEDAIGQVLLPPGERGAVAETNGVKIHMPAAFAAIEFALEVSEFAARKLERPIGLMQAVTGDRSRLMFLAYGDDLDDLAQTDAELNADSEYQEFYKRSEGLMVPGTLERNFWQLLG